MKLKTREELSNSYWSKFLKTGKIEDYLAFKRINNTQIDEVEFGLLGEDYDYSKKTSYSRDSNQKRNIQGDIEQNNSIE